MNRRKILAILLFLTVTGILLQDPVAASPEKPSVPPETIVLISLDTLRADHVSCYGYEHETTPHIDALAKESLFFENPFATVPMTLPSHCSIFTGLIPAAHGVHVNTEYSLPVSALTLAEILKQNGYTTYGTVSAVVIDSRRGLEQGFDEYDDALRGEYGDVLLAAHANSMRDGGETTERAIKWLDANAQKKKFMFIHYFDPHAQYEPPPPYDKRFKNPYDGDIAYTDYRVGQFLDRLKALGLYDKALIVLIGDHGEMLGEHGEEFHSFFIYHNVLRTPMMFKLPGATESKSIEDPCSLIDIAPTILSLAGLTVPESMQGIDLSNYLRPDFAMPNRPIFAESMRPTSFNCSSLLGLIMGRWHYIQSTRPELYDRIKDPGEIDNLIDKHPDRAESMKKQLKQLLAQSEQLAPDADTELDAAALEQLESLGYLDSKVVVDYSFEKGEEDAKDMVGFAKRLHDTSKMLRDGQGDEAIKLCLEAIEQYPKVKEAYKELVGVYTELEDFDKAVEVLKQIRTRFPDDWLILRRLAEVHIQRKDYPKAIGRLNEFMALKKDDAKAYKMLADAYKKNRDYDKAIATLKTSHKLFPDKLQILIELAKNYEYNGDTPSALATYLDVLARDDKFNKARTGAGHIYYRMRDLEKAHFHFKQALIQDPYLPAIHGMTALIETDNEHPKLYAPRTALKHAQAALSLSTDRKTGKCRVAIVHETLSFALAANGRFDEAMAAAATAIQLHEARNSSAQADRMKRKYEEYRRKKEKQQ